MGAAELLQHARAAGFRLSVADGNLLVTPASKMTDNLRAALRAAKSDLLALLLTRTCTGCLHLLRRGTCGEPVAAGLLPPAEAFGIVWPPEGHGTACRAFTCKMPMAAANRPHRLTKADADRCHAPCWADAEIAAFTERTARFAQMGRADADELAELLTLRDRDGDDRRFCLECSWLGDAGRCLAAASGRIPGADRRLEPAQTILQRCVAFGLRKGLS